MKEELADECNYAREASFMQRFGTPAFLGDDGRFKVPWVWQSSTDRVLVMQYVDGVSVGGKVIVTLSQKDRDDVRSLSRNLIEPSQLTFIDRCPYNRVVPERAFRVQSHADGSELDELPVECQDASGTS